MGKQKLILIPSIRMDSNKKDDRNENGLVRMSKVSRDIMGFKNKVELYPNSSAEDRLRGSVLLDIFHAFSSDIEEARTSGISEEELSRVGFVTTKTYNRILGAGNKKPNTIWITEDINDTVVGADPEFLLFDKNNRVVRANSVLSFTSPIGCDGAMAEIRPKPAISPEEIMDNILTLLTNKGYTDPIKDFSWMAGCYYKDDIRDYPIGGHIHIGNPVKVAEIPMEKRMGLFKSLNKILDELLAIPMIKIDGDDLGRARRTESAMGKYGFFGEFRPHQGRLEYRTLSGMWLMHPKLTKMVFGVTKAIVDEVYRHIANKDFNLEYMFPKFLEKEKIWSPGFDGWDKIPLVNDIGCVCNSDIMINTLNTSSASKITAKFLNSWFSRMKKLSTYKMYSEYIDELYEVLKNKPSVFQKCNKNIQNNWLEGAEFLK